jgi:Na+-driven multidrug efflux pump
MLVLMLLTQWRPEWLRSLFTREAGVIEVGSHFLRIASINFVASGLIFTCSGIFQGLGHTWPALGATSSRVLTFMIPAIWLTTVPGYRIDQVWYLSVASVWLQAGISVLLLRRTMAVRLAG